MDQLEVAVYPDREGGAGIAGEPDQLTQQIFVVERRFDLMLDLRLEPSHRREGRERLRVDLAHPAVHVGAVEAAVERDHLPVERVEGPEAEVSVLGELR